MNTSSMQFQFACLYKHPYMGKHPITCTHMLRNQSNLLLKGVRALTNSCKVNATMCSEMTTRMQKELPCPPDVYDYKHFAVVSKVTQGKEIVMCIMHLVLSNCCTCSNVPFSSCNF